MTVSVRSGLPATALMGEIELIENGPDEVVVTLKVIEFDFKKGSDPIGSPVSTNTLAVTGLANSAAGITAVSSVLLTKVVSKNVSLPLADHTTTLLLLVAWAKFDPLTVSTRSGLPAIELMGEIEIPGAPGDPFELDSEPQPPMTINRVRKQRDAAFLVFMTSSFANAGSAMSIKVVDICRMTAPCFRRVATLAITSRKASISRRMRAAQQTRIFSRCSGVPPNTAISKQYLLAIASAPR